ncbi:MAG TPA: type II secretion system protein [Desulfobacteraceae bacterium]|nr:type II secretion system protein [Desulfobacteraceae bacterium]
MQSSHRGFTLLEVMVSLALISIALITIFSLQAQNLNLLCDADFNTRSVELLRERLSQLRAQKELDLGESSGEFEDHPGYGYVEKVEEISEIKGIYRVEETVFYETDTGRRTISIISFIYGRR